MPGEKDFHITSPNNKQTELESILMIFGFDPMSYRTALHENNGVVSIFSGDGGGKTKDIFRLALPGD